MQKRKGIKVLRNHNWVWKELLKAIKQDPKAKIENLDKFNYIKIIFLARCKTSQAKSKGKWQTGGKYLQLILGLIFLIHKECLKIKKNKIQDLREKWTKSQTDNLRKSYTVDFKIFF